MIQARASRQDTGPSRAVKDYLSEYGALKQRREALAHELERLEEAATRATTHLSPTGHSGMPDPAARETAMLRLVDGRDILQALMADIGKALAERLALIERLPDERYKMLLTLRYVNGLSWEEVGYAIHYERTQVYAMHTAALEAARHAMNTAEVQAAS